MQTSTTPPAPARRRRTMRSAVVLGGGLLAMALALSPLKLTVRTGPAPAAWAPIRDLLSEDQWQLLETGTRFAPGEGRSRSRAIACVNADRRQASGAFQTLRLDQPRPFPLRVSGWSRAENVDGAPDADYALHVSVEYVDGSRLDRVSAEFDCSSHDWQRRELLIPALQPVKSLLLHCLFRNHAGRVWFDDVTVREHRPASGSILFEGGPWAPSVRPVDATPAPDLETRDGLRISVRENRMVSVDLEGVRSAPLDPAGFLVRDAAADGPWRPFDGAVLPEMSLRLDTRWRAAADHLAIDGELRDLARTDRAISLAFLLPLDAVGWNWSDDGRRARAIVPGGVAVHAVPVPCGATASRSRYPLAAVWSDRAGVAIAADPGDPVQFRVGYHAELRCLFIAWDFGLLPDGVILPSRAPFRFSLFRFDGSEGFRGALQKLYAVHPDRFSRRCLEAGSWLPFTSVDRIPRWQEFGFAFREATMAEAPAVADPLRTFRYTEPLGWWTPMADRLPRTSEGLRARLEEPDSTALPREAVERAAMRTPDGLPRFSFQRQPWCDGVLWSMNPNPLLPGAATAARLWWSSDVRERLYLRDGQPGPGGEFVDSAEGYAMAELNFDRLHLRYSSVPPAYSCDGRVPVLFKGQMMHEYAAAVSRDLRPLGKFLFGNGTPDRFSFLAPAFDVLGTEVDWFPAGVFAPATDGELSFRRAMAFQKPFCILLNTRPAPLTPDRMELYFQRCLFYGMFPGLFSHDAQNDSYWENPARFERDRPLFLKYMPLLRRTAAAGWQPVPLARSDNPALLLERFGPDGRGIRYLTVLNDSAEAQEGTITLRPVPPGRRLPVEARDLLADKPIAVQDGRLRIALPPGAARLLEIREPDQK